MNKGYHGSSYNSSGSSDISNISDKICQGLKLKQKLNLFLKAHCENFKIGGVTKLKKMIFM